MNNTETPIEIYNWIEYFCLSIAIFFIIAFVQPLLLFFVGVFVSIYYRKNLNKYFKFTVTYVLIFYINSSFILYKQDNNILTIIALSIIVAFILYCVIKSFKEGKSIWES